MPVIVYFWTSNPSTSKMRSSQERIKHILRAKGVDVELVDLACKPHRLEEMLRQSGGDRTLPQLHVDGKFIGDADAVQEMEDFGDLDPIIKPASAAGDGLLQ